MALLHWIGGKRGRNERTKAIVMALMVLFTSVYIVEYTNSMFRVDSAGFGLAGLVYSSRYVPLMMTTALGGAVPGMMSVILVFIYNSVTNSSFSYLTFIYLVVVCVTDLLTRRHYFDKWYKVFITTVIFMNLTGTFWGILVLAMTDYGLYTISIRQVLMFFMNQLPGSLLSSAIIYNLFKRLPPRILMMFDNGKYYVDPALLTEDEKYVVEGRSKLGKVVMNIIVLEALILGIFAELASNTLVPNINEPVADATAPAQRSIYGDVNSSDRIESLVSTRVNEEALEESSYFMYLLAGNASSIRAAKYSVRLAMLLSIIVIPMAVFMNRYAQRRIAEPIRLMSKAMSDIYNANDISIDASIRGVHELDIATRDEIEELYHAVDLTVYRLVDYIELVKTRQNIEDQLQIAKSANEAKSQFLYNISHEIRTPINAVLGFDEMILRETRDANIVNYAKDIQSSGKTLLALINDLLDFSKIEAGKMEIIPVEYELGSLMNDIVNMSTIRAREKNLKLNVNVNEQIPHILFGDEIRIKQCIINIITNAVKYTEIGHVDLDIDYDVIEPDEPEIGDESFIELKVSVTDTGIGIREEDMDKLNTAFERLDMKKNRTIEGTGLGISIVTNLLGMMGSKLEVQSQYGQGSTFSFVVRQEVVDWQPVGDFSEKLKEAESGLGTYKEAFRAKDARILVVDDTRTNLTVIQGLLKQTKIQVDTATSGMEALELVKQNKYNIIFLDHRMPEMDGIQTLHAMEEIEDNPNKDTPIIALTANAISGSREMYLREGFTNYMSKPVEPSKLEDMIIYYLPKEMVEYPSDTDEAGDDNARDEENEALQELLRINGVDITSAIERCGSAIVARDVMKDFWMGIDEKAGLIEKYMTELKIKDYTILVHGLKSSALAIGALELSEKAKYLESCGNGGDIDEIETLTPELLRLYRSYLDRLAPLTAENDAEKPEISSEELDGAFESIREFVSASYFDSADDIMNMLEDYAIPEAQKAKYHEVKRLLAAVDRDGLLNIL